MSKILIPFLFTLIHCTVSSHLGTLPILSPHYHS